MFFNYTDVIPSLPLSSHVVPYLSHLSLPFPSPLLLNLSQFNIWQLQPVSPIFPTFYSIFPILYVSTFPSHPAGLPSISRFLPGFLAIFSFVAQQTKQIAEDSTHHDYLICLKNAYPLLHTQINAF